MNVYAYNIWLITCTNGINSLCISLFFMLLFLFKIIYSFLFFRFFLFKYMCVMNPCLHLVNSLPLHLGFINLPYSRKNKQWNNAKNSTMKLPTTTVTTKQHKYTKATRRKKDRDCGIV